MMDDSNQPTGFDWDEANADIVQCRRCPRLVEWREAVAQQKRKSFLDDEYWGKAVPHFGDPEAKRLIIGLAPAAHGANRTGRMFTGDRSGDWLFRALYKAGAANQPTSTHLGDGLKLKDVIITATCHCAPPVNKPLPSEIASCRPYFLDLWHSRQWKSVLCLGSIAWNTLAQTVGVRPPIPFGPGAEYRIETETLVVGSYHPSQQNTFTGKLTEPMFDAAIQRFLEKPQ